jgi:hypothetical protein
MVCSRRSWPLQIQKSVKNEENEDRDEDRSDSILVYFVDVFMGVAPLADTLE